ncbi:MAG: FecR family protein [Bryobacteraceae bacterium]|jgi:hypothetical protein
MLRQTALSRAAWLLLLAAGVAVCQIRPGIPDNTARVVAESGQVSAMLDSGEQALFVGNSVKPQQMIVTGPESYAKFEVADGSTFEVFADSRVMFRERAGSLSDLLNVFIGHVKVYIQHLNGLPNYNKVTSPTAVISVRGTVFDVVVEDDDGTTLVSVDEGVVTVRNQTAAGDPVVLQPGDSIRVYRNQPLAVRTLDKGALFRTIIRMVQQAMYQVVWHPQGGVGLPLPGGGSTSGAGASGDTGKGGGTAPTSPGAPTAPSAPGAPTAPGKP